MISHQTLCIRLNGIFKININFVDMDIEDDYLDITRIGDSLDSAIEISLLRIKDDDERARIKNRVKCFIDSQGVSKGISRASPGLGYSHFE